MGLNIAEFSEWLPIFEEEYIGEYRDSQELADEYFTYSGIFDGIPEHLTPYFDSGAYVDNLIIGGDIWETSGHYFWNR
jgi:antirestriction protein